MKRIYEVTYTNVPGYSRSIKISGKSFHDAAKRAAAACRKAAKEDYENFRRVTAIVDQGLIR